MNAIKENEIKLLKELSTRKDVKGKRMIKDIIWLNEVEAKYKKDDVVLFQTEYGHRIVGTIESIEYSCTLRQINYNIVVNNIEYDDEMPIPSVIKSEQLMVPEEQICYICKEKMNVIYKENC